MPLSRELATEYVRRFPNAATKTIANKLYKENSKVFTSPESARGAVRKVRGAYGKAHKPVPGLEREPQKPGDPFGKLPAPWYELPDWHAEKFDGPLKALILSDIHCPFHDLQALTAALKYGKDRGADTVILNGDTMDCYSVSRWVNDPRLRNFKKELDTVRQLLGVIRDTFKNAHITFKHGNHCERLERYFKVKAVELFDVDEFQLGNLLKLKDLDITEIKDMRRIKLGSLNLLHGHEYRFPISNPVGPARGLFLKAIGHCMVGHFHQTNQYSNKTIDDNVISCWSTGSLCGQHPAYRPINGWNLGFAFVSVDKENRFEVNNLRIIDGGVYN